MTASTEDISSRVQALLAEICALPVRSVQATVPLIDYGLDSARAIDLVVALESEFDLRIPDDAVAKMKTVEDVVAYVQAHGGKARAT